MAENIIANLDAATIRINLCVTHRPQTSNMQIFSLLVTSLNVDTDIIVVVRIVPSLTALTMRYIAM